MLSCAYRTARLLARNRDRQTDKNAPDEPLQNMGVLDPKSLSSANVFKALQCPSRVQLLKQATGVLAPGKASAARVVNTGKHQKTGSGYIR